MPYTEFENTFWYSGIIVEYREPQAVIKGGKMYAARSIIVENRMGENRISRAVMYLPYRFDKNKISMMIKKNVFANFLFCLRLVNTKNGGVYNSVMCLSIEPADWEYRHLRQRVTFDPYCIRENTAQTVDKDGYAFPYDY
nr:MAG TPA: hypothetical protein [Caudoviricetes sp.]